MSTHARRHKERDGEYADGSLCFLITKPVALHALDVQLSDAMGWRKDAGLLAEGDPLAASEDAPVPVWVLRADVDANTVKRVVTAHEGVEESPDIDGVALTTLREKAVAGEKFDTNDVQAALRLLLTRG